MLPNNLQCVTYETVWYTYVASYSRLYEVYYYLNLVNMVTVHDVEHYNYD